MKQDFIQFLPYKGYLGRAYWDDEAKIWHGRLQHIKDVVTFVGSNRLETAKAFRDSVDDYLKMLKEESC